jgi:hypothetical protein
VIPASGEALVEEKEVDMAKPSLREKILDAGLRVMFRSGYRALRVRINQPLHASLQFPEMCSEDFEVLRLAVDYKLPLVPLFQPLRIRQKSTDFHPNSCFDELALDLDLGVGSPAFVFRFGRAPDFRLAAFGPRGIAQARSGAEPV